MKVFIKLSLASLLAVAVISCTKTSDTGISLTLAGTNNVATVATSKSLNVSTQGFTFSEALVGIRDIEIKTRDEHFRDTLGLGHFDDGEHKNHNEKHNHGYGGTYLVDLLAGTSAPALGFTSSVPGTYDKFEAASAPAIDGTKTMSLKGTYVDSLSNEYKFEFSTIHRWEYEFKSDTGYVLDEGKVLEMLVSINLPGFFKGVDFSAATRNADNVVVIDENTNLAALKRIKLNLHSAAGLTEDHNGEHHHSH